MMDVKKILFCCFKRILSAVEKSNFNGSSEESERKGQTGMDISKILLGLMIVGASVGVVQLTMQLKNKFRRPVDGSMEEIYERAAEIFSLERNDNEEQKSELLEELKKEFDYFNIAETGIDTLYQDEEQPENQYMGNLWSKSRFESGTIDNYTFLCIYRNWNLEDKIFIQKKMMLESVMDFLSTSRKKKVVNEIGHFEAKFFINSGTPGLIHALLTPDIQDFLLQHHNKYPFDAMEKGPGGIVMGRDKVLIVCRNMKKEEQIGKLIEFGRKLAGILDVIISD